MMHYLKKTKKKYICIYKRTRPEACRSSKLGPTPSLMNQQPALGPAMSGLNTCPFLKFNGVDNASFAPNISKK